MARAFSFLILILMISGSGLTGCVTGPFASYETARTVGAGRDEVMGGFGTSGYVFKWTSGVTGKFDLGLQLEQLSVGLRAKYAFLEQEQGLSFAAAFGIGASGYGGHAYVDLMFSDAIQKFEPYTTLRISHVSVDELKFHDRNNQNVIARIDAAQFNYGQIFLGTRYWLNPNWSLSGEVSILIALGEVHFDNNFLASGAFGYRF